ncbi:MAG TPA: ATP-binding protein, partial [Candidatus Saccharimonadales bacterium]
PLLGVAKSTIVDYARAHNLEWREDVTNDDDRYLRNRIRKKLHHAAPEDKQRLYNLYQQQLTVVQSVDAEIAHIMSGFSDRAYSRYFFVMIDDRSATELLHAVICHHGVAGATRPQLRRALVAIKTYRAGARHVISGGVQLVFTSTTFIVEHP